MKRCEYNRNAYRRPGRRRLATLAGAVVAAVLLSGSAARGQSVMSWLDPRLIKSRPVADYRVRTYAGKAGVREQAAHMRYSRQQFSFTMPVYHDDTEQWRLTTQATSLQLDTSARMPDTGEAFPDELWDFRLGGGYGRRLDDDRTAGVHATIGSAGDKPFATAGETALSAVGFYYKAEDKTSGWLTFLTAQSQLDGTGAYAFPGFGYHIETERVEALLGLPVFWAKVKPVESLALQGLAMPSRVMADATWTIGDGVALFATYDWEWQRYVRHDRFKRDEHLFYTEQRLWGGLEWDISKHVKFVAAGGYGFDRRFYEADNYFWGSQRNRMSVGDGPMMYLRLRIKF